MTAACSQNTPKAATLDTVKQSHAAVKPEYLHVIAMCSVTVT